jgi:hypothetical protein
LVEQKQSAIQRIQVGVVGLVVVLLFVTLATMVLDRVSDSPPDAGNNGRDPDYRNEENKRLMNHWLNWA